MILLLTLLTCIPGNLASRNVSASYFRCDDVLIGRHSRNLPQSVMDTTDTSAFLYDEAFNWNNSADPQNGLDTMRLFVERHPNMPLINEGWPLALDGLSYTYIFTEQVASKDTNNLVRQQCWIDEYNWLASVYPLDTTRSYRLDVIGDMA